jgi:hypothetical protein
MCGYIAECQFILMVLPLVHQQSFGEFDEDSGIWKPINAYSGLTYGGNGCYLDFDDSASNLGSRLQVGMVHDFTLNNITSADQATDTPTNNFCIA